MEDHVRVCFISTKFSPLVGGAEKRVENQARRLHALGHDVTVVTTRYNRKWKRAECLPQGESVHGLPVVRVGGIYTRGGQLRAGRLGHWPIDIGTFMVLWRLRHHYDVLHAFELSSTAAVATLVGKITGKPVIISLQSTGPNETQRLQIEEEVTLLADTLNSKSYLKVDPSKKWMVGGDDISYLSRLGLGSQTILNFLRRSNAYYQVASTRGHDYLTSYGFRAEQIVHIPTGVDTEKFRPSPERRPDPAKSERSIICVARLEYPKGVDVLLHAWGRMMHGPAEWRAHLNPRLYLVGEGLLRPQLECIVADLGIQDTVEFLGLRNDTVDLLQKSWGFVLPSRWEGMPNALLEAMACGLPCVATRVSGSEDLISDGINSLLVEPEQPAEMAQALHRIIEDTNLAQRLGQEGRASVVRDYQLMSVANQYLDLYRCLHARDESALPFVMKGERSGA